MSQFLIKSIGNTLNFLSHIAPKFAANTALNLFAKPRQGRYNDKQEKIVASAEKKNFSYDGFTITTYQWKGNGKTILLAHGWESNASRWAYLLEDLKGNDYNIIALDAPAHGKSGSKYFNAILYSEFINVVVKAFNPEVVIGHSVGGMATVFGLHNHEFLSVKKAVLLGAPAHFDGVFKRYKDMMGYNNRIAKGLDAIVLNRFNHPVSYFSAAEFTKQFNIEGLVIHDKQDKIIPYEDALLFEENFKDAQLITTKGFGHGLRDVSLTPKIIKFINT